VALILGVLSLFYFLNLFSLFFFSFQKQGTAHQGGEEVIEQVGLTCLNIYAHLLKFPSLLAAYQKVYLPL
jgi:hypothetical protein